MELKSAWQKELKPANTSELKQWGKTLVVAPHPDDESLGCGGTIALLRQIGIDVYVVFMTDGSQSHPDSLNYPRERLIRVRELEAIAALSILGVDTNKIIFLRFKDGSLPFAPSADFKLAVSMALKIVADIMPATILLPWRRDPHTDHRATWQILDEALQNPEVAGNMKRLEYFIWLFERAAEEDLPLSNEMSFLEINIADVIQLKMNAIAVHLSQTTKLIDDDPNGFILSPEMIAHFHSSSELFAETVKAANEQIP